MSTTSFSEDGYRRELGGSLVLRWSTERDMEGVANLYAQVFRRAADAPPNPHMPIWVGDMFSGRHPHITARDFAVVEDTREGKLVAATCLLGYTCAYDGVPFGFGRPEVVASLPEYRNQGLIRAIFELIHARCEARGDLAIGITGIPYYYRQFGYEYAVEIGGELTVYFPAIPALKPDEPEPFTLRDATLDDVPQLRRLYDAEHANSMVTTIVDETYWRWLLAGMHPEAWERWVVRMIVNSDGRTVGYLIQNPVRWGVAFSVDGLAVEPGVSLAAALPSVLRGLQARAETVRRARPDTPETAGAIVFRMGAQHPVHAALGAIASVADPYPYPWYMRVPDLPAFIRHIAPVLERRLADSVMAGYTGELAMDFYRGGLRLVFEQGRLTLAEDWRKPLWGDPKVGFPPLVFTQLLFGHRSLDELRFAYPDAYAEGDALPLLEALFPKRRSHLLPLD
ncbi:MAG: hypothetical protein OJF49_002840 [Ktedonobacterales bacterium]|nr:MAG: hypothetical protein OJF49_002840 [Ktedonobacterales bacterium]